MTSDVLFGDIKNCDKWLYHYTSKETALEHILDSGKIRLNLFRNVNDPRESRDWNFSVSRPNDTELTKETFFGIQRYATDYVKNRCKILCMVRDDARAKLNSHDYMFHRGFSKPRMWAQYGRDHTGVCLIMDREKLMQDIEAELSSRGETYISHMNYVNYPQEQVYAFNLDYGEVLKSSLSAVLDSKIHRHHKNYFFTKAEDWANENEWRCLLRGESDDFEYLSIEKSICGIVLGSAFPKVYENAIKPFKERYSIEISRMNWNNGVPQALPCLYET